MLISCSKYIISMFVNKIKHFQWPKIVFGNLCEDITGQYFWDKGYTLKLLVYITLISASPANTTVLRYSTLQQLNAINLLGKKWEVLVSQTFQAVQLMCGQMWIIWRSQGPKPVKHPVFKASTAFGGRQFCPEHSNIWPKWAIFGGQAALAKLFCLSCQTSGVLQVLLMLKAFCLD